MIELMFNLYEVTCEGCHRKHSFIYESMEQLLQDSELHGWYRLGSSYTLDHCQRCYSEYLALELTGALDSGLHPLQSQGSLIQRIKLAQPLQAASTVPSKTPAFA